MSTPRANHSVSRPNTPDTLPYSEDESEDECELISVDEWFAWFKTTDEYKELKLQEIVQVSGSTNEMVNTGTQPKEILSLIQ